MNRFSNTFLREVLQDKGYIRGPFGSALLRSELTSKGIPVYEQQHAIRGIREFRFFIGDAKYIELKRFSTSPGDLIISCSGTVGEISMITKDDPLGIISQALLILRTDPEVMLPEFLRYYLITRQGKHAITTASHGSVQLNIAPRKIVENIELPLPTIIEQKAISNILVTLDRKIEFNKKTNKNLEEIAKALFKSWFIDFDPVKAKSEGLSTGLPDEISQLFPDSFEDSELGKIPMSWLVRNLGECSLEIESGRRPKGGINKELDDGIPSVGAESIDSAGLFDFSKTKFVTNDFASSSKKGWVKNLDVALYKDGGKPGEFKPRVAIYGENYPFNSFMVNEHVFLIRSKEIGQPFLYYLLKSNLVKEQIIQKGSSKAAQPGLNQEEVKSSIFPKSNKILIEKFNKISSPIIKKQLTLGKQNIYLENLRNAILPKLISGQLRIIDAEKIIEESVI